MPDSDLVIRPCFEQDMQQVALIYAHHVTTGVGSFEIAPPGLKEMRDRWTKVVSHGWPWMVASPRDDITRVAGFAYAQQYRDREAYAHCFEDSIYVAPGWERKGVGFTLLASVLTELLPLDVRQVVAVIGGGAANAGSVAVHAKCGFSHVGTLWNVGWKFGRWHDVMLMQRALLPASKP